MPEATGWRPTGRRAGDRRAGWYATVAAGAAFLDRHDRLPQHLADDPAERALGNALQHIIRHPRPAFLSETEQDEALRPLREAQERQAARRLARWRATVAAGLAFIERHDRLPSGATGNAERALGDALRRIRLRPRLPYVDADEHAAALRRLQDAQDDASKRRENRRRAPQRIPGLTTAPLTPEQRELLELRLVRGLSLTEAAEATGRTVGAVKAMQHRALRQLEKWNARPHVASIGNER